MKQSLATLILCIAAAITLAACGATGAGPSNAPGGDAAGTPAVHMDNNVFKTPATTIQKGQRLTLTADTFAPHVIANGSWQNGEAKPAREAGAPQVADLNISGNRSGTIGPFSTTGTFQFYCTIHPNMNLAVSVE